MTRLTKKQILALTDEQFAQLSFDEMKRAMKIQTKAKLEQMAQTDPETLVRLAAQITDYQQGKKN